jgi:hypothetical protein
MVTPPTTEWLEPLIRMAAAWCRFRSSVETMRKEETTG